MSSIDNRIVVLTFDNKDFERNVQTSMNTLDKLKNGLNLEGATKGLSAISASAKSFNLNPIGEAIDSIRDRFSNLGIVGMTVIQNLTNRAVDLAANVFSKITSGGIKRAMNLEQANFMLEGLFGNVENKAEKVQEIMNAANEAVSGTAYGLDEAAKVASQLVASGIRDGERMSFVLRGIAGTAAMTGGSYEELGNIFTTVAGTGKLMTEQLRQFEHRGLNVAATLAEQFGTTEAEIREMVHDGVINFDMFSEAMANAFGEHAQEANKTFAGSLSNVYAALSRLGAKVASPGLERFRDIFNVLAPLIDQVSAKLQPFIDFLNDTLGKAAMKAVDVLTKLYLVLGGDVDKLRSKITYASDEAKEHVEDVISSFTGFSSKIREELAGASDSAEEAADSISQSTEEIEEMAQRVINGEFGNGEERRRQLEELGYSYEEVQNKVNELLGCDYRYEVQTKSTTEALSGAARAAEEYAIKSQTLSQALGSEIFQNFADAVTNIKTVLEDFGRIFRASFRDVFNARNGEKILIRIRNITDAFLKFTDSLVLNEDEQKGLGLILAGLFKALDLALKGVLKGIELFLNFATVVANITTGIFGFIGALVSFNGEVDETSRKSRLIAALAGVFNKVGEAIKGFKDKLVEVIERVQNTGGFMRLKRVLSELWETIKEIAGKIFDKLIEKMNKFAGTDLSFDWMDGLVSILGKAADKLASFFEWINNGIPRIVEFFQSLRDGTNDGVFGKFIDFFVQAKDAVVEFFKGLFGGTDENGEQLNLFEKIKNMFQSGIDNVGEFFSGLKTEGFVEGFKSFLGNIAEAMTGMDTQTVLDFLKQVGEIIMKIVLFASVVKFLKSASNMMSGIGSFFSGIGGYFKNLASTAKATVVLIAIGEIIAALYVISKIPKEDLLRSVIALGAIMAGVLVALKIVDKMNLDDSRMKSFAVAMAGLGTGLLALSGAMVILSKFTWPEFLSAAGKLAILITMLVAASKLAGDAKCAAAFMGLAVAVNLLVPALFILGHMKWETIIKGATAIGVIALELGLAAKLAGSVKAAAAFMGLAVAVDLIVPAFAILGKFKWETIKKGAIALGIIVTELSVACRIASSPDSLKGAAALLAITVPIAAAVIGIKVLGNMERDKLIQGAVALVAIMTSVALATRIADDVDMKSLLAMVIILAEAVVALYILKDAPWQTLLAGGAALSAIMLSLAAAMNIAEDVKPNIVGFLAMMVPLYGAVGALYILKDAPWQSLLAGGAALSMVMLSIAGALEIGKDAQPMAALALDMVTGGVLLVALALKQLGDYDWKNLLGAATGLSEVLIACSIAIRIMAGIGPVAAIVASLAIDAALAIIMGFVIGFTVLLGKINDWTSGGFLTAVQNGKKILEGVGEAIGGFIGGIGVGITDNLPTIADNLSEFAENLKPFFDTMKGFGTDIASTISTLAGALLEITGAEFMDGIIEFVQGESSLSQFGSELETFAPALKTFWTECKCIKAGDLTGASLALTEVCTAAGNIPNEGLSIISVIVGDNKLGNFAVELMAFGPALKNFWTNCKSIKDGDLTGAANSLTEIATAAGNIPNEGLSIISVIVGDNKLSNFAPELMAFGPALKNFWTNCKSIKDGDITGAANATAEIGKAAAEIPNQGLSVISVFAGDNRLSKFGAELELFGPSLKAFADSVKGIESSSGSISVAVWALRLFADAAGNIENQGGFASLFTGDNTLSKFGKELVAYGEKLATFVEKVKDVNLNRLSKIVAATIELVNGGVAVHDAGKDLYKDFGADLKGFGENLGAYYESIKNVSTAKISQVVKAVYELIAVGKEMAYVDTWAMGAFGEALGNAGSVGVSAFVTAFQNGKSEAISAVSGMLASAASGSNSAQGYFYNAGVNGVQGLINGFASGQSAAYWTAYNICIDMVNAAYAALQIRSPSKVMRRVGDFAGQGLVLGLKDTANDVKDTSDDVANLIVDAVAKPFETLQNIGAIDLDIDPVITPVLDLSNIDQGINTISGMFNSATPYLSLNTGYGSTMFNSVLGLADRMDANSSGSGSIVNAINEIRSDVANLGSAITRMQIKLDGQTLVGEIVDPLDEALGERMDMRQRGLI